jgi:hypothetical protein
MSVGHSILLYRRSVYNVYDKIRLKNIGSIWIVVKINFIE